MGVRGRRCMVGDAHRVGERVREGDGDRVYLIYCLIYSETLCESRCAGGMLVG
jgi:hypothetical protein